MPRSRRRQTPKRHHPNSGYAKRHSHGPKLIQRMGFIGHREPPYTGLRCRAAEDLAAASGLSEIGASTKRLV